MRYRKRSEDGDEGSRQSTIRSTCSSRQVIPLLVAADCARRICPMISCFTSNRIEWSYVKQLIFAADSPPLLVIIRTENKTSVFAFALVQGPFVTTQKKVASETIQVAQTNSPLSRPVTGVGVSQRR